STSWPWATNAPAPLGVSATRFSSSLISRGTPIVTSASVAWSRTRCSPRATCLCPGAFYKRLQGRDLFRGTDAPRRAGRRGADVHRILVQLPRPGRLDAQQVIEALPPGKDVDGLHPVNQGRLLAGQPGVRPCTPLGVMRLLDETGVTLRGAHAVVVGRSVLVGKPVALLLLERHATVTLCHSRTADLAGEV